MREAEAEDEEDAEIEYEIDEQSSAEIEEPSLESLHTAADYQAAKMCKDLLETIESDHHEGDHYLIQQKGDVTSVMAADGRGLLLLMEGEEILESHLEPHDIEQLQQAGKVLDRCVAEKEQAAITSPTSESLSEEVVIASPTVEPPSLDLAPKLTSGIELD